MRKNNVKYTNEPMNVKIIADFLPTPEELVLKEDNVKVTLTLTKKSIEFFKKQGKRHHTGYQKMIRTLLDKYVDHYI